MTLNVLAGINLMCAGIALEKQSWGFLAWHLAVAAALYIIVYGIQETEKRNTQLATAWHRGCIAGLDRGILVGEILLGIKDGPLPKAPVNPYKEN